VCFQNRYPPANDGYFEGDVEHGTAFVVAKIAGLAPPTTEDTERPEYKQASGPRYRVLFGEYAEINLPNAWQHWRNPVIYGSLGSFGIKPNDINFQPMPDQLTSVQPKGLEVARGATPVAKMTIAEAKQGLSATFGVPPDAIEITIRG
jgi:hypothetical protein